jgi:hypothetical protein
MLGYGTIGQGSVGASVLSTAPAIQNDSEAPVIPGALVVSAVSSAGFTVEWQGASDNIGVTGYEISVDVGTVAYLDYGMVLAVNFGNLLPGTSYTVRVRAYDAAKNKSTPLTTQVTTSAPVDIAKPVWSAGSVVSVTSLTSSALTAAWPAAVDNVGVVSYEVSVDTGTPNYAPVVGGRLKTFSGLLSGTTYNVRVRAVDATGNTSPPLTAAVVTSGVAPVGDAIAGVSKVATAPVVVQMSPLSASPVGISYRQGSGQELVLFNNSDTSVVTNLQGSSAGRVTTKGLAGVTIDLSGGLPINVPARQFVTLKLDNASAYLAGNVTLTANTSGTVFAGVLQ